MSDVINSRLVKSVRKPHYCAYCGCKIDVGESAEAWTWADGGQIFTSYGHPQCNEVYLKVPDFTQDPDYLDGNIFLDDIWTYYDRFLTDRYTKEEWKEMSHPDQSKIILEDYQSRKKTNSNN